MDTRISSPHAHGPNDVTRVMLRVVYALVPAIVAYVWLFGFGIIVNLLIASAVALGAEAAVVAARNRPVKTTLADGSAFVTAVLLAFALPPLAPWWLVAVGTLFAIVFAKHLYGGLGYNPFNPAMAGYVLLLVSFPLQMTTWVAPGNVHLGFADALSYSFSGALPAGLDLDAVSGATALDFMRTELTQNKTVTETLVSPVFGMLGGQGFEMVNGLVLLGGLWLIMNRTITWHAPAGLLGALFVMASVFYMADPDRHPGPLFHLMSGGAILGAFFIATDPTSGATSNRGRFLFGAGAGVLIFLIRTFGGYPDAVAFAVLLMNVAAPTIDYYTQPRVFGHGKS